MDAPDIKKSLPPAWNRTTNKCYPTGSLVAVPVPWAPRLLLIAVLLTAGQEIFVLYKNFERTASWTRQNSYSVDTNVLFPNSKEAGTEVDHSFPG